MKQLKFMLAAATAIGLAAAAQAASTTTSYLVGTENTPENFDADNLQGKNPVGSMAGYSFEPTAPATASDNESIVTNQVLNVNTGTDPLFRHLNDKVGTAVDLTTVESLYIDTKVQFTVTPAGDLVKPSKDAEGKIVDKLMIYLAEVTNDTGVVTGTNLMVQAGKVVVDDVSGDITGVEPDAFAVTAEDLTVVPNEWYNLKVNAVNDNGLAVFTIFINNKQVKAGISLITGDVAGLKFPSMQGPHDEISNPNAISLTYVGFAGEGKIDDLTVATITTVDSVDFTFALTWSDDKISAVAYTTGVGITKDANITGYEANGTVALTITPASWYKLATEGVVTLELPSATPEEAISLDDYVTKAAEVTTVDGKVTVAVTENTKPSDVGVMEGSFAADNTAPAELNKALTWALNKGDATAATIGSVVGNLNFANTEETDAEKAYLLDCTEAELTGDDGEIAKFKFVGFDLTTGFTVGKVKQVANGAAYGNGYVEVRGDTAVNGAYTEAANTTKHSFFKAFLVPFQPAAAEVE